MTKTFKYEEHKKDYENLWATCSIRPEHEKAVKALADRILKGRTQYEKVANMLAGELPHISWWIIGVIHHMEAGCDFNKYQQNGAPVGQVSKIVPKGIIFDSWEDSALAASRDELTGLDGTIAKTLAVLEGFNGYGYRLFHQDVKSPYLWSFTNHYTKGKYVEEKDAAGVYRVRWKPDLVSQQCGIAAILENLKQQNKVSI